MRWRSTPSRHGHNSFPRCSKPQRKPLVTHRPGMWGAMVSANLLRELFPAPSLRRLQLLERVRDPAAEDPREAEVAAGGRVEGKNRIRDYELANHAPIQEVCRHKRGLGDFIGESRANA